MKSKFTKLILIFSLLFAGLGGSFFYLLIHEQAGRRVLVLSAIFVVSLSLLFYGYLMTVRREMLNVLSGLSVLIQELSAGNNPGLFPENEDSLLSKLQSQIIQLSGMLTAQKQRYREESREVKSLISDISHQLKTPLANLGIYSGLLQDDELPDAKRQEFTRHLGGQIEKLSWLMDSLIKLSRLESGIIKLRPEPSKLEDTVLSAIKQAFPAAARTNTQIVLESSSAILLLHDPKWTAEAIYNILDNALKYAGQGNITIKLQQYDLFARIDIADQGPGISQHEINAVFQRFYRGKNAMNTDGAGIGLYLTRKIVSDQGGYIRISSEPGRGSVFSVFLPQKRADAQC